MFANMYLAYATRSEPVKTLRAAVDTWNIGDRRRLDRGERVGERMVERTGPREAIRRRRKALYIGNHTQTCASSIRGRGRYWIS